MSGCAHARMGILGPHPSPECEDARPSLPALRSGWAITYSQRTRPRINNQHTTTAWRVSIALYFTSFSHPGRAAGRAAEAARRRRFWHLGPRARFHPAGPVQQSRPIFASAHITYLICISCGVSYYCKHRVMKSAILDYY